MSIATQKAAVRSILLERLRPHPMNSNRMAAGAFEKLKHHIERTGLYEPIVVRPAGVGGQGKEAFEILNGHHRIRALGEIGHKRAKCVVWDVSDSEALVLLATLNRLEGKDDPHRRGQLIAALGRFESFEELARKLPEPKEALERLVGLTNAPPVPIPPAAIKELDISPLVFYLDSCERRIVEEALRVARGGDSKPVNRKGSKTPKPKRSEILVRIAQWYLEAKGAM